MQVGCGFRVKGVQGQDYVYFWHYEDRDGRSRQVYEYMGPRRSSGTASRLTTAVEAYYAAAGNDPRRQPTGEPAAVTAPRSPLAWGHRFPHFRACGGGGHL